MMKMAKEEQENPSEIFQADQTSLREYLDCRLPLLCREFYGPSSTLFKRCSSTASVFGLSRSAQLRYPFPYIV